MAVLLLTPALAAEADPEPQAEPPIEDAAAIQPATPAESLEAARLQPGQQREFELLLTVIRDNRMDRARRRDAAAALLQRDWPAARDALLGLLTINPPTDGTNAADDAGNGNGTHEPPPVVVQRDQARVVAAALSEMDNPPALYIQPLLHLLRLDDAALRQQVAEALARYENRGVTERLIAQAADADIDRVARLGAIRALGEHRQAEAIEALIQLIDAPHPEPIRAAALDALRTLTGINDFAGDASRWRQWWRAHRDLPRDRWLARLVRSLSATNKAQRAERRNLTERLTEVYGELYIATDEGDRPALMRRMLNDPLRAVRLQAIGLAERQLLNGQTLSDAVRQGLRSRLTDDSAEVRIAATNLLRDLDDQPAVAVAADRLLAEPAGRVRNAYLALLAREPTEAMVAPARRLLDEPTTQSAAAAFLRAARDAGVLTDAARRDLRIQLRRLLAEPQTIEPETVRLLAPMTTEADAERFTRLLDHAEAEIARAASEAFITGPLNPEPLYAKLGNPVLGDRALAAVAAKGDSLELARRVLRHRPGQGGADTAWRNALTAVVRRLNPADLVALDDAVQALPEAISLRRAVLGQVAEREADGPKFNELLLRLGELSVSSGELETATAAVNRIEPDALGDPQRRRLDLVRLDLHLRRHQIEPALALAERLRQAGSAGAEAASIRLLDAAGAALADDRPDDAEAFCAALRQWDGALDDAARQRLTALEAELNAKADATERG